MASLVAIGIRAVTLLVVVKLAGAGAVGRPFDHVRALWLVVTAAVELLTYAAYVLAYLSEGRFGSDVRLDTRTVARIVVAGFGPVALAGGFSFDTRVRQALEGGQARAEVPVGAMATIEWAVLAPATWVVVIVLLASGANVSGGLLWPWALGVPAGVALALWASAPGRMHRLSQPRGRRIALGHIPRAGHSRHRLPARLHHPRAGSPKAVGWMSLAIASTAVALRGPGVTSS